MTPATPHQKLRELLGYLEICGLKPLELKVAGKLVEAYLDELIGPDQVSHSIPKGMATTTYERLSHQDMLRRELRLKGGLK